jgi:hypothetical protein
VVAGCIKFDEEQDPQSDPHRSEKSYLDPNESDPDPQRFGRRVALQLVPYFVKLEY